MGDSSCTSVLALCHPNGATFWFAFSWLIEELEFWFTHIQFLV